MEVLKQSAFLVVLTVPPTALTVVSFPTVLPRESPFYFEQTNEECKFSDSLNDRCYQNDVQDTTTVSM